MEFSEIFCADAGLNPASFHQRDLQLMSEPMSGIYFLESRGVPSDSESASVREPSREIQPLEFSEIFTDFRKFYFTSFHRRDRRDELRVAVASARNIDVFLSSRLRASAFVDVDLRVTRSKIFLFSPWA